MYFKIGSALVLTTLMLSACAKVSTPASQPISVKLTGAGGCLSDLKNQMTRFTDGQASPDEIRTFWSCMQASIQKFEDITSGDKNGGNYSPEALRHFIEHYFYNGQIPDDVLAGIMEIKRILLSGDNRQVTREELTKLHSLFDELNSLSLSLQPHIRILLRKDKSVSEPQVLSAVNAFRQGVNRVGAWLLRENQTLTFQQVRDLADALARWTQTNGKDTSAMHTLKQAALVMPDAKSILIGGDKTAITGEDWPLLTEALGRGYYLYLAFANGYDDNLDAALTRTLLPDGAASAIEAIAQSAKRHPNSEISLDEFKSLYTKLAQTDWLSSDIKEPALTAATKWLLTRLLGDGTTQATALTLANLDRLHQLADDWHLLLNQPENAASPLVQEFNAMLAASKPIAWDSFGRMQFPASPVTNWNLDSRRHMIWPYVALKLIKNAYVGAAASGLNEDQVTVVAQEILPLLQNFGWMKSTKDTIGRRILREADLFTLASNGDGILDLNEATRYLAFVMGSYRGAQFWLESSKAACPAAEPECVRAQAEIPNSNILSNMPRLQKVMAGWQPGQFNKYMKNAESTILGAPETGKFTTGDLLQSYQLFEYVEVFLEIYDVNNSEDIDLGEATAAFKIYGPTLGRLLPGSDLGFFTFMFKIGTTPFDPAYYGAEVLYNNWVFYPEKRILAADRRILMGILAQLAAVASR